MTPTAPPPNDEFALTAEPLAVGSKSAGSGAMSRNLLTRSTSRSVLSIKSSYRTTR
jgi:hypothetical protein